MGSLHPINTSNKRVEQVSETKTNNVVTNRSKRANLTQSKNKENKAVSTPITIILVVIVAVSIFGYVVVRSNMFYYTDSETAGSNLSCRLNTSVVTIVAEVESNTNDSNSSTGTNNAGETNTNATPQPPGSSFVIQYGSGAGSGSGRMVKVVNDWLTLYDNTTVAGNYYSIDVTAVSGYVANKWSMGEGQSYTGNAYAKQTYTDNTMNRPNGAANGYVDGSNRYWVAVGPCVTNKDFNATIDNATAGTVGYGKFFDIVLVENSTGNTYYVPLKSGDCKVHTHPTGIIQTGSHIPDGSVAPGHDDHSIVEWVGVAASAGTALNSEYTLKEIIVYE